MDKQTEERKNKLPEQLSDVLLLLDDLTKTIRIVKGVDKNGQPETVAPQKENESQFLKIDKHGDIFSNFFSNFIRQIKNPTRFRFFRVSADNAVDVAKSMQNHLQKPTAEGEKLIKQHEVVPQNNSNKEQQKQHTMDIVKEEKSAQVAGEQSQKSADKKNTEEQSDAAAKEYRYKPEEVDWSLLGRLGLDKEKLEKMKLLEPLLMGHKSGKLVNVSFNLEGVPMRFDARISLQQNADNKVVPAFHGIRREPNLDFPFFGHEFTAEDKKNLLNDGNMGRVVDLVNPRTNEVIPSLISIDKLTNEVVALRKDWVKIPDQLSNVKLTEQQKEDLREGKSLYLEGMVSQRGTTFDAKVQFNADKKYVEYLFDKPLVSRQKVQQEGTKEAPKVFRNKELTEKKYDKFKEGATLFIRGFEDKKGQKYDGYITYNKEKGTTDFSFKDPRKVQGQAIPVEASKTQKAVNSDGKTNEATKHIGEPLQKAQQTPKDKKQQEQQEKPKAPAKSKGRKM